MHGQVLTARGRGGALRWVTKLDTFVTTVACLREEGGPSSAGPALMLLLFRQEARCGLSSASANVTISWALSSRPRRFFSESVAASRHHSRAWSLPGFPTQRHTLWAKCDNPKTEWEGRIESLCHLQQDQGPAPGRPPPSPDCQLSGESRARGCLATQETEVNCKVHSLPHLNCTQRFQEGLSPATFLRSGALPTTQLQSHEQIHVHCCKPPICGGLIQQPQDMDTLSN